MGRIITKKTFTKEFNDLYKHFKKRDLERIEIQLLCRELIDVLNIRIAQEHQK